MRVVLTIVVWVLLLAVGVASTPVAQQKGEVKVAPAAPTSTIRVPFYFSGLTLDPHRATDAESLRAISLVYDTLYAWQPGETPRVVPSLAADWPSFSEDGLTVTIKLRPGVTYHKNPCFGEARTRPVKASDVVASFKRAALFRESGLGWMIDTLVTGLDEYAQPRGRRPRPLDIAVEGLTAIDDSTLQLNLTRPCASLPTLLAHPTFSVVPREALDGGAGDLRQRAVGSGPYRLNAVAPGSFFAFTPHTAYWGDTPSIDRIVFAVSSVDEVAERVAEGIFSEFHVHPAFRSEVIQDGKLAEWLALRGAELLKQDGHGYYFVAFNMTDAVWGAQDDDGRKLRRALALACDRETAFRDAGYDEEMLGAQGGVLPAGAMYRDDDAEFGRHDVAAARALLAESKYKGGVDPATGKALRLSMLTSDADLYAAITVMLEAAAQSLGIEFTSRSVNSAEYRPESLTCDESAFVAGWFLDYPDPANFLQLFHSRNIGKPLEFANVTRFSAPAFDKLLADYEGLMPTPANEQRRAELTAAMAELIKAEQPMIPLLHERQTIVRSTKVSWPQCARQTYNDLRFAQEKAE